MPHVTLDICTKDRYSSTLPLTLASVLTQTRLPDVIYIYDDSENRINMPQEDETLRYLFQLAESKGLPPINVIFGEHKGQHHGHQIIQSLAKDLVWRIDDDEVAEPNTLQLLLASMKDGVGAVGGLVLMPGTSKRSPSFNKISNLNDNCQWHPWMSSERYANVEHLYSSYLYRKGIHDYQLSLSPVAHREETLHSFGIFKKGYKLVVDSFATTYHFRSSIGGIRTGKEGDWHNDEILFNGIMREYGIGCPKPEKNFVLNEGKGDHVVFASLVPDILAKYGKSHKLIFYVTYPDVFKFKKYDLDLRSIKNAYDQLGNIESRFNLYECMVKTNEKLNLEQAYRKLYDI
jgi:hypothetical protein